MNLGMNYCPHCGTKLIEKQLDGEGKIPYCNTCNSYIFPRYNTAVSMIVTNQSRNQILLIQQYGKKANILVAGYVNPLENAEHAVKREIKEEVGLDVVEMHFNRSSFYEPSETLMLNFTAVVKDTDVHPNNEVDSYGWYSLEEAKQNILHASLAEKFLLSYLNGKDTNA